MNWGGPESLSGRIGAAPAALSAVAWSANRLDVFGFGGNRLNHWWWDGTVWAGPETLGRTASAPTAVSRAPSLLDVFTQSQRSSAQRAVFDNHWSVEDWGGHLPADEMGRPLTQLAAVSWGPYRLDLFSKSVAGALLHWWWDEGAGWRGPESLGGRITHQPSAASWAFNRLDVFGRGVDATLQHWWWDSVRWSGPESLGGTLAPVKPSVTSWGPERLDIFGRAPDGALQHWWFEGVIGWGQPESLGGALASDPCAVAWGPHRLDVFGRGTDHTLKHWWFDSGAPWGGPESLGGALATAAAPAAVSWGPGRLDVFGRGLADNSLQHWWWGETVKPSQIFHDEGDNAKKDWASRAIVARDVVVAGWLSKNPDPRNNPTTPPWPNASEDCHYDILLDPDFIARHYGTNAGPLEGALLRGNQRLVREPPAPKISLLNGQPVNVGTFLMPGTIGAGELTVELNAWHEKPSVVEVDAPPSERLRSNWVLDGVRGRLAGCRILIPSSSITPGRGIRWDRSATPSSRGTT